MRRLTSRKRLLEVLQDKLSTCNSETSVSGRLTHAPLRNAGTHSCTFSKIDCKEIVRSVRVRVRIHPLHIKISRCILIKGRPYDKVYAELKSSYRRQGKGSSQYQNLVPVPRA